MADFSGMIKAIKDWAVNKFLTEIPIGSDTVVGGVKADGTTTTIDSDGTIHATGGGGGTGTTDYNGLSNKPSIGGVTLSGDKTLADLGLTEATTDKSGLMSADDKKKIGYTNVAYGRCYTSAYELAKVVEIEGNTKWELKEGSIIFVTFSSDNVASNPTLNVNGTGAYRIVYDLSVITDSKLIYAGKAGRTAMYVFNGANYVFMGWSVDMDTTYTNPSLGNGYGTCYTEENTLNKVVDFENYSLVEDGMVCVKFSYAVPAGSTMNINGKGAKKIYYKRNNITDGIIKAGDIAVFIFNNSVYNLVAIDSTLTPSFETPTTRSNIVSGESLSTLFGKISKWFSDLKPHAFVAPITNLLTTVAGSALDATMGKELDDKITANTTAIEEVNSSLNEVLTPTLLWSGSATIGDTINLVKDLSTFKEIVFYISGTAFPYKAILVGSLIKISNIGVSDSGTVPLMFTMTFTKNSNTQLVVKAFTAHQFSSGTWNEIPSIGNYKLTAIYGLK